MADRIEIRPAALPEFLRVFWRRRRLLGTLWMVFVVAGVAAAFLTPSVYESSVVLGLERLAKPGNRPGTDAALDPRLQADVMNEQVRSEVFLRGAITASGIDKDAATRAWALRSAKRYPGSPPDEAVVAFLTDHLRGATIVTPGDGSAFKVTVADRDRARARGFARAVGDQFLRWSRATQIQEVGKIKEYSLERQQVAKARLEDSEGRLATFRRNLRSTGTTDIPTQAENTARAQALQQRAKVEAEEVRRRVEALRRQLAGRVRDEDLAALSSGRVADVAAQMVTLERQLASVTLTDSAGASPARLAIVRKHGELAAELSRAAEKSLAKLPAAVRELAAYCRLAEAELEGVEARRDWLARQVSTNEQRAVMAPEHERDLKRLSDEVERNRALHDSLVQQSAASQLAEAFDSAKLSGRLSILEPARWPNTPARPNRPVLVLLAIVAGGLIGAGTVMVVERYDPSVKNAEEVGGLLGLPVLGALSRVADLDVRRRWPGPFAVVSGGPPAPPEQGLLSRLKVDTALGLELRRIFLELSRRRGRRMPHTLAVTSATRGEGKSTATAGLAITLARELRQKVLLVDFDLRNPGLHRALGLPSSSWGLAQVLGERHFDTRFVRATVLPHLDFLPAGKSDRLADELIEAELVEWFIKEAMGRYPIVIMDCPPNLTVPDALVIGRAVEGVLFVVKAGSTARKAAENGVRLQREWRDNVLGVLINDSGEVLPQYALPSHEYHEAGGEMAGGKS